MTGCVFRANEAYWGGAIAKASKPISGCVFEGNVAGADGGAVYKSSNVVTGSVFTANRATGLTTSKGGGLWGAKAIGCAFTNNVGRYGGAMAGDLSSNPGVAIDCTFSSNYSIDTGGALYKMTAMTNCWVGFNQSTNQGGACQWCYGISGCVFTGNRSMKNRGGALSESEALWRGRHEIHVHPLHLFGCRCRELRLVPRLHVHGSDAGGRRGRATLRLPAQCRRDDRRDELPHQRVQRL